MKAKAIVMEICEKEAVVLNAEGSFVRIRNNGFVVGQEIMLTPDLLAPPRRTTHGMRRQLVKYAAIAACIALLIVPLFSLMIINSQSYGYVSMDVNPSIEYHTNRFDKVIEVTALNQDGEALLSTVGIDNLEGEDIEVALSLTIQALDEQGYLEGELAGLIISTSSKTEKASIALNQKIKEVATNNEHLKGAKVDTEMVSNDLVKQAKNLGTTAGKLKLIKDIGEDVDVKEWLDKSVAEIHQAVKEHGSASGDKPAKPVSPQETRPGIQEDTVDMTMPPEAVTQPNSRPNDKPQAGTEEVETDVETEAEITHETQNVADEAQTKPEETIVPPQDTEEPLVPETEEGTIPPEPDKDHDFDSWWEWFLQWILGKL